jgi:hypothetical protein
VKETYKPTARLRFIERPMSMDAENCATQKVLQQWWGVELPAYMRDDSVGEWRDVPTESTDGN